MQGSELKQRRKRQRASVRNMILTKGSVRLSGGKLGRVSRKNRFLINHRIISMQHLSDKLHGLKITHLSDPHIGELITPDHLPSIVESANDMAGDLIAVTGDFIDYSNKVLPDVIDAMKKLQAPLGTYFVLGNHDYLDNAMEVKSAFQDVGLNLLLNEAFPINVKGQSISVGGIDWTDSRAMLARYVRRTYQSMSPDADLKLLLAHHPHAFDTAQRYGIDLTLAGHTHGGQVLLSKTRGKKGSIGLANLGFRYTRGYYSHQNCHLFVSSGVGSWFPFRFRCPAEMTSLELQSS